MLILGEEIDLAGNLRISLRRYWFLWLVLLITICLDFASTMYFMQRDGIIAEANPVIRWLANKFGMVPGVAIGKVLQLVAAAGFTALSLVLSRAILLMLLLLNITAVVINLT